MIKYNYIGYSPPSNYLMHHGVKGQKWGVRNEKKRLRKEKKRLRKEEKRLRKEEERESWRDLAQRTQSNPEATVRGHLYGKPFTGTNGAVRRETIKKMTKEEHEKYNRATKGVSIGAKIAGSGLVLGAAAYKTNNAKLAKITNIADIAGTAIGAGSHIAAVAYRRKAAKRLGYTGLSESAKNKRKEIREQNSLLRKSGARKVFKISANRMTNKNKTR